MINSPPLGSNCLRNYIFIWRGWRRGSLGRNLQSSRDQARWHTSVLSELRTAEATWDPVSKREMEVEKGWREPAGSPARYTTQIPALGRQTQRRPLWVLRPAQSTEQIPGWSEINSGTLSKKRKNERTNKQKEGKKVITEKQWEQSMLGYSGRYKASGRTGLTTPRCDYSTERTDTPLLRIWEGHSSSDAPGTLWPTFLSFSSSQPNPLQNSKLWGNKKKKKKNQSPILWKPLPFKSIYQEMFLSKSKQHLTLLFLDPGEFRLLSKAESLPGWVSQVWLSLSKPRHQEGEKPSGDLETPESESRRATLTHSLKLQAQSSQ